MARAPPLSCLLRLLRSGFSSNLMWFPYLGPTNPNFSFTRKAACVGQRKQGLCHFKMGNVIKGHDMTSEKKESATPV